MEQLIDFINFHLSDPIYFLSAVASFFISIFGYYMATKIKRPAMFKVKLVIIFLLPFLLGVNYMIPFGIFSYDYHILLNMTFIVMLSVLYWREIRKLTTLIGYNKTLLVNFLDIVPDMVWMKDTSGRFTYVNRSLAEGLLKCTREEAFGKTGKEIAEMHKKKGEEYTFGDVCCRSDNNTLLNTSVCRFLECGSVCGEFKALEVFKAPLHIKQQDGSEKIVGTIGMGRDMTQEYEDHMLLADLCSAGKVDEAMEAIAIHINRFTEQETFCNPGIMEK